MRLAAFVVLALALAGAARAGGFTQVTLAPVEDVGVPYWCSWGYDWDERCYRDDSERLPLGGARDKVWRSALRFSLATVPADAAVVGAELRLWFDGTCVAAERRTQPCPLRRFDVDAHPVYAPRWQSARELEFGPLVSTAELEVGAPTGWRLWNLSELVEGWVEGSLANEGVLLKLADPDEDYAVAGPAFASVSFGDAAKRPRLVVSYWR